MPRFDDISRSDLRQRETIFSPRDRVSKLASRASSVTSCCCLIPQPNPRKVRASQGTTEEDAPRMHAVDACRSTWT